MEDPALVRGLHAVTDLEPDHDGFVFRQTADAAK